MILTDRTSINSNLTTWAEVNRAKRRGHLSRIIQLTLTWRQSDAPNVYTVRAAVTEHDETFNAITSRYFSLNYVREGRKIWNLYEFASAIVRNL
jgi:hypothetical protein